MNAETEIEAVNMTLGAGAAGARAGTGSCGQGIALMQEAIAEAAMNEVPFVVFNMARGQQDYFQATRGGGWGDYRTICLAPKDVAEAVEHTQLLFHLADRYRAPVMMYGDYLISHTYMSVEVARRDYGELPAKDWALDGRRGGTGKSRQIWTWAMGKANDPGPGPDRHWQRIAEKFEEVARAEARSEAVDCDDAETVVVSFGTAGALRRARGRRAARRRAPGRGVPAYQPVALPRGGPGRGVHQCGPGAGVRGQRRPDDRRCPTVDRASDPGAAARPGEHRLQRHAPGRDPDAALDPRRGSRRHGESGSPMTETKQRKVAPAPWPPCS